MGKQIHLLEALPKIIRDPKLLKERRQVKKDGEDLISRMYGYDYFDGDRKYGYGGYHRDERWFPVVRNIASHYGLNPDAKLLDVGCAKGYLVDAFCDLGMNAYGLDVSRYAVKNCPMDMVGRIHRGDILDLHFPDNSFDLVLALNVVHNLDEKFLPLAFKELQRVSKKDCFITVDSYYSDRQKAIFEDWVLTAKSHGFPEWWIDKFAECGYVGDYDFTVWDSGYD